MSFARCAYIRLPVLMLLCSFAAQPARAQQAEPGTFRNFNAASEFYPPPNQAQMKSLLQGAEAKMLPDRRVGVNQLKLQTFSKDGQRELQVLAPECIYDQSARAAFSPGTLRLESGDGKFSLEGQGFLWLQTNISLIISSQVHTVVQPHALDKFQQANRTNTPARELTGLDVTADQFTYSGDSGLGIYQHNVKVTGTNLSLTGGRLTLAVPMAERLLQSLTAEENVDFRYQGIRATGERMHYDALQDTVRVTGNPFWSAGPREGRGDELFIDHTNMTFIANGNASLKMPAHTASQTGFLPGPTSAPQSPSTNQTIEILCDQYEFRTNSAEFRKGVSVKQFAEKEERGTMTCQLLTIELAGTNQLKTMTADQDVVISQQDNQLTAGRLVYDGTTGLMDLTQNPAWRAGSRQGKGDTIKVDVTRNEMFVLSNASMRLPADQFGAVAGLRSTNNPGISNAANAAFATITSEQYSLKPNAVVFQRDVLIEHPQMTWRSANLTAEFSSNQVAGVQMVAEGGVVFELANEGTGSVRGKAARAVYFTEKASGATNSFVQLTGNPVLETTNGTLKNELIVLDVGRQRLFAPGKFRMRGTVPSTTTNAFELPRIGK